MDFPAESPNGGPQEQFQYAAFAGLTASTGSAEPPPNRADDPQFDMYACVDVCLW